MSIAMFLYIGIAIQAKWIYWVCFGVYCFGEFLKVLSDDEKEQLWISLKKNIIFCVVKFARIYRVLHNLQYMIV